MGNLFSHSANTTVVEEDDATKERRMRQEFRMQAVQEPSAFRQLKMSDELLQWLIEGEEIYTCPQDELVEKGSAWAFEKAVDYPHLPNHVYYEGYGHGNENPEPIKSMNPRWGNEIDKNRGPKKLVAFFRCFKKLNEDWLKEAYCIEDDGEISSFGKLVNRDLHLADLAMQFHCGDQVKDLDIGWHRDGKNSACHMAVSILGKRALHMNTLEDGHTVHWQEPGDFYIGTPYTCVHAVEYPEATWDNKAFAIQGRFLFPTGERNFTGKENTIKIMEQASKIMKDADIVVPTLVQVQEVYESLLD